MFDGVQTEIKVGEPYYRFDSSTSNPNPTIYLARGGEYTFEVEQEGAGFWIQSESGLSGVSSILRGLYVGILLFWASPVFVQFIHARM